MRSRKNRASLPRLATLLSPWLHRRVWLCLFAVAGRKEHVSCECGGPPCSIASFLWVWLPGRRAGLAARQNHGGVTISTRAWRGVEPFEEEQISSLCIFGLICLYSSVLSAVLCWNISLAPAWTPDSPPLWKILSKVSYEVRSPWSSSQSYIALFLTNQKRRWLYGVTRKTIILASISIF